jgi:lipopolysaccharide heptosyltransferase I
VKLPAIHSRPFERILLIKPSAFGDVVHTLPVLVKLRARYPAARIDWLITPENAELVRYHPALSNVVLFNRRDYARFGRSWSATTGLLRLLHGLWRARYDLVVDMHGQLRSALFTIASGASVRIGFDRHRSGAVPAAVPRVTDVGQHGWAGAREGSWIVYSHRIPVHSLSAHAVDRYLWVAPLLGLDASPPDFTVYWPPEADDRIDTLLARHGLRHSPFAILVPTTIWATKHWHVEGFAQVGRYLLQSGLGVVLAGAPNDRVRCRTVAAACPGARDLCGETTLAEFAALMQRAAVNVTNDSGSMHLAVALGRPVVSVFGPTDPVRIGPYGRPDAVVRLDLPCSPCYLKDLSQCPYNHACMTGVTPAMVIERLRTVLPLAA